MNQASNPFESPEDADDAAIQHGGVPVQFICILGSGLWFFMAANLLVCMARVRPLYDEYELALPQLAAFMLSTAPLAFLFFGIISLGAILVTRSSRGRVVVSLVSVVLAGLLGSFSHWCILQPISFLIP